MSTPYPAYGDPPLQVDTSPYQYPPSNNPSQYPFADSSTTIPGKHEFAPEHVSRTPSPTPSEAAELAREGYYVIAIILTVITALVTIFHHQIVDKLTPTAHWVKRSVLFLFGPYPTITCLWSTSPSTFQTLPLLPPFHPCSTDHNLPTSLPGGWSIPIVILFILSFPPLFGHEIIAILCGVVWGLWIGFAIVAAGTFLGELGNFYAFKYCCTARGEKLERTNMQYGCLARVVREGGFRIALIARLSAIPGHFTTAVFSTCGMSVWTFSLAAFLSLPKQFATVYIGVIIEGSGKQETTPQRIASYSLIAVTTIITFLAAWYIFRELKRVKPAVIYERRKARQAKIDLTRSYYNSSASSVSEFNPNPSESDIPLRPYDPERDPAFDESTHQRWDEMGHAVGYAPDPRLHAPRPRPPSFSPSTLYGSPNAAAAATSSPRFSEDEWSNARTPQTARPPVDIPAAPPSGPSPAAAYTHTSSPPTSPFQPPRQSPHSGSTHSPPSSTTIKDATYQPEHFSVSPSSSGLGPESGPAYDPYSSLVTESESVPSRAFSPPPEYR
ncbi:snare associated Golgi protein-domain-containing protein [Russula brevipes]|nr:snare associated Golgi protein-domain-containing protein [Russula brevipes]